MLLHALWKSKGAMSAGYHRSVLLLGWEMAAALACAFLDPYDLVFQVLSAILNCWFHSAAFGGCCLPNTSTCQEPYWRVTYAAFWSWGSVNGSYFSSISKRKLQAIVPLWLNLWFIETVAEPTRWGEKIMSDFKFQLLAAAAAFRKLFSLVPVPFSPSFLSLQREAELQHWALHDFGFSVRKQLQL